MIFSIRLADNFLDILEPLKILMNFSKYHPSLERRDHYQCQGCKPSLILDVYIYHLLGVQFSNPQGQRQQLRLLSALRTLREKIWRAKEEDSLVLESPAPDQSREAAPLKWQFRVIAGVKSQGLKLILALLGKSRLVLGQRT